jgi:hypothetical protein
MRRAIYFYLASSFLLLGWVGAQPLEERVESLVSLDRELFRHLPLADTACPDGVADAHCYVHGFGDFFEFRAHLDRLFGLDLDLPRDVQEVSRWRFVEGPFLDRYHDRFYATYRLQETGETFTLIYLRELLILQSGDTAP